MRTLRFPIVMLLFIILSGCKGGYSFTGGNVGEAKTLNIDFFDNTAAIVNPEMSQIFTESLKDIFVQQTSLRLVDGPADLEFSGAITDYSLRPQAARGPSEVAQMRFTIAVKVSFENSIAEESSFEQRFSRSRDTMRIWIFPILKENWRLKSWKNWPKTY